MPNILLVDKNLMFTQDITKYLMINDYEDLEVTCINDISAFNDKLVNGGYDFAVIEAGLISSLSTTEIGIPLYTYCTGPEGVKASSKKRLMTYGIKNTAGALLSAIDEEKFLKIEMSEEKEEEPEEEPKPVKEQPKKAEKKPKEPVYEDDDEEEEPPKKSRKNKEYEEDEYDEEPVRKPKKRREEDFDYDDEDYEEEKPARKPEPKPAKRRQTRDEEEPDEEPVRKKDRYRDDEEEEVRPRKKPKKQEEDEYEERPKKKAERYEDDEDDEEDGFVAAKMAKIREEEKRKAEEAKLREEFERDAGRGPKTTKVVTIYSSKGGVGKTTISCELATYLALTAHGRGNYKVCLVDFNIDFGDVMATMGLEKLKKDREGNVIVPPSITEWSMEINDRLSEVLKKEGFKKWGKDMTEEDKERIIGKMNFAQKDIMDYIQVIPDTGLHVLCAPRAHQDSFGIKEPAFSIMLENLIKNGDYDFIICDTGNNTRDSSMVAVKYADSIYIVATQDVRTAFDIQTFLKTADRILPIDFGKVKLVINMATSSSIGVSLEEVKDFIRNPKTKERFDCVATIQENSKVKFANNKSEHLVQSEPKGKFTASIGRIAMEEIGDTFVLKEPEKKGLFSGLFKKKK